MPEAPHEDIIFISGGTGTQGSATIRALLRHSSPTNPVTIHALVRDPNSHNAQALAQLSPQVKLFKGDNDNPSTIAAAAESCTACLFVLITGWKDFEIERRQAQNILSVLTTVPTIKRVVYTTTAGVQDPRVPGNFKNLVKGTHRYAYFEGKHDNEIAVQKTAEQNGWVWTIIKPGNFLTNFLNPMAKWMYPQLAEHRIVTVLPVDYRFYFVDPEDIGQFNAAALLGPRNGRKLPDLSWQKIELASQVSILKDAVGAIERALAKHGKPVKIDVEHITVEEAERRGFNKSKTEYEQFLAENTRTIDLDRVRSFGFELGTMNSFFEREVERIKDVLAL